MGNLKVYKEQEVFGHRKRVGQPRAEHPAETPPL